MINLYAQLNIEPHATANEVQHAITAAAQKQALPLPILEKCKEWLLNTENRQRYTAKLFATHPELLQTIFDIHFCKPIAIELVNCNPSEIVSLAEKNIQSRLLQAYVSPTQANSFAKENASKVLALCLQLSTQKQASPPQKAPATQPVRSKRTTQPKHFQRHLKASAYVESNLTHDEELLYVAQVTWWSQTLFIILGAGTFLATIGLFLGNAGGGTALMFIATAYFWGRAVINVITTELALTDKRIIAKFGFIRREVVELNLHKAESIIVNQSILGRILGYGSIKIRGTGGGNAPIPYISNPLDFKKAVSEVISE